MPPAIIPYWLCLAFCRIFFVLKSWEIATKDSSCIKTWSFWDYVEFLLTSDNRPLRVHRGCELQDPRASKKYGIVYPKDRNVHFYLSLGFKWIATWAAYGFTKAYFDVFPLQNLSGLVSPINISQLGNCLIYAIMLLCCLELSFAPLFAFVLVLDAPYAPIFNKPYIATSLRDFWSNRWNLIIKEFIHTLAFKPTLELCKSWFLKSEEALLSNMADDNPSQSDASIIVSPTQTVTQHNPVHMALALMAGFLFSGLLHEVPLLGPDSHPAVII
ncbi:hypothetical protein BC830DRAFT_582576 [Chytriomyces sp. MP71]|nr:hypothetical protein BC830DRAFT_582576 [Chytriomyces sp. MP71]